MSRIRRAVKKVAGRAGKTAVKGAPRKGRGGLRRMIGGGKRGGVFRKLKGKLQAKKAAKKSKTAVKAAPKKKGGLIRDARHRPGRSKRIAGRKLLRKSGRGTWGRKKSSGGTKRRGCK